MTSKKLSFRWRGHKDHTANACHIPSREWGGLPTHLVRYRLKETKKHNFISTLEVQDIVAILLLLLSVLWLVVLLLLLLLLSVIIVILTSIISTIVMIIIIIIS